jgi:hypothetical protein
MCTTIREIVFDGKVSEHFDLGLLQEVIRPERVRALS